MDNDRPIAEILCEVQERIAQACRKVGRSVNEVAIIGVTKTHGPELVTEAWEAGLRMFGENRIQEATWKIPQCVSGAQWHMIGHLQRNKARAALEYFSVIHSVDSIRLLEQLETVAEACGRRVEILLEVNVSGESSKDGVKPEQAPELIEKALECHNLTLTGLMTMAPFYPDPEQARSHFAALRECRDIWEAEFGMGLPNLSMGMSNDYLVAVEEGATWLRLGTILFGHRPKWRQPQEERWEP